MRLGIRSHCDGLWTPEGHKLHAICEAGGVENSKKMMHSVASSSQLPIPSRLAWSSSLQRKTLTCASMSLQRKTLTCASMSAERLPSPSLSKTLEDNALPPVQVDTLEDNAVPPVQVDWLSLRDEEFEESVETISSDFGPDFSKMDFEEFAKFCKRRGLYVAVCSKRLSELVGNVDLLTPWKKQNRDFSVIACNDEDFEELESPAVKESHDSALKARTSNNA